MKMHSQILARFITCRSAILFSGILFSSCTHLYYSPNSSNVPLFKKKGEARLNAYYSGGNEIAGAEIQGAVAVSKNIGLILNTAFMSASDKYEDGTIDKGNGHLLEAGAGYYKSFAKNLVFETYGGFGFGGTTNEYYTKGKSKVNFTKAFIQPSLGFTVKNVDFGLASKLAAVFMNVGTTSGEIDDFNRSDLDYIKANPTSFLWEPSFFVRFGFAPMKLQLQYTPSININNKSLAQEVAFLSIGLSFNIQPKTR